MPMEKRKDI